ncbi:MAG TPA: hypothetical protein VFT84_16395, partial [Gemmatimonadales bacterium]|nr:hypothetical protein [Gemmatimonadales bacterium]
LNAIRASRRVPVSGLGTLLGVLALIAGLSAQWAVDLPLVAVCLVVLGFGLLLRQFVRRA